MIDTENLQPELESLLESQVINKPEANLRSKIGNQLRTIKSLEEKKARIEYELKKQKRALIRKREELKKDSKRFKTKATPLIESQLQFLSSKPIRRKIVQVDDYLLQESARIVDY